MPNNYRHVLPEVVVPGKPLGRNVNHDPRSLQYKVVYQPARTIVSVTHERAVPVFDQGNLGSCTGNASVGAVGTKPLYDGLSQNQKDSLNELLAVRVYSMATSLDGFDGTYPPDDTGSDGLSVAKACKALGLISGYLHATSLSAMQQALLDTPVIVGVNWYEGFDETNSEGFVRLSGQPRGGHEFEVIGMNVADKYFICVNSWGPGYGLNGVFKVYFTDMDRLLHEDGDCTQLLPVTVPAPTPTPGPGFDPIDRALVQSLDPWERTVVSRITRAGKAKIAYDAWKLAKGLDTSL